MNVEIASSAYVWNICIQIRQLHFVASLEIVNLHNNIFVLVCFQKLWKRIWRSGKRTQNNNKLMLEFVLPFIFAHYIAYMYGKFNVECSFILFIQLHKKLHILLVLVQVGRYCRKIIWSECLLIENDCDWEKMKMKIWCRLYH